MPERAWARRLGPGGYVPWLPEADGRWHSRALGVSFARQGFLLLVYDQDGQLVPLGGELRAERERWQAEQDTLRAENARLRAVVDEATAREAERERRIAALEAQVRQLRGK